MSKTDKQLGMHRSISRRDFIAGSSLASLGLLLPAACYSNTKPVNNIPDESNYPPIRTGMRGSHPGSYEVAHGLAREGRKFDTPVDLTETYDLVVVGAGISGLAAAYAYRKKFGADSRILILDNHDDFGGHAKRNEFHQGGRMRLSWGGTMNLEYQHFNTEVNDFLAEIGIYPEQLANKLDFHYGSNGKAGSAIYFDEETYGRDVLVKGFDLYSRNLKALERLDEFPISEGARTALKQFYTSNKNILEGLDPKAIDQILHGIPYTQFLAEFAGLPADAIEIMIKGTDGYWGIQTHSLSVSEAVFAGMPGAHLLGTFGEEVMSDGAAEYVAMFPDGNAAIARLLVRALIPNVTDEVKVDNIAFAKFNYSKLDLPDSLVRLRLESTVVNVANEDEQVVLTYLKAGKGWRLKAKHAVLACYHSIIPHLCPTLPEAQKEAQRYQVKLPMILTNVLLRNSEAIDKLGITGAYCPGRLHAKAWLIKGVNTVGYQHDWSDQGTVPMMFWGIVAPPQREVPLHDQLRASRYRLLQMSFEDFEREVRTVLDGMLGAAGFDVKKDILAITVNRWPHGYAYEYMDLWDNEWPEGKAPHEIARQTFGNIAIANSDAGASAYTQTAIGEALRAVRELEEG